MAQPVELAKTLLGYKRSVFDLLQYNEIYTYQYTGFFIDPHNEIVVQIVDYDKPFGRKAAYDNVNHLKLIGFQKSVTCVTGFASTEEDVDMYIQIEKYVSLETLSNEFKTKLKEKQISLKEYIKQKNLLLKLLKRIQTPLSNKNLVQNIKNAIEDLFSV